MFDLNVLFLPAQDAFQVHQAGHIGCGNDFRPIPFVVADTVFTHFDGYIRLKNGKCAAKTATFVFPV